MERPDLGFEPDRPDRDPVDGEEMPFEPEPRPEITQLGELFERMETTRREDSTRSLTATLAVRIQLARGGSVEKAVLQAREILEVVDDYADEDPATMRAELEGAARKQREAQGR